jgi:hypothetical protein
MVMFLKMKYYKITMRQPKRSVPHPHPGPPLEGEGDFITRDSLEGVGEGRAWDNRITH